MADVTWVGGTHQISDPSAWSPNLPGPGDVAFITDGTATAVDQTVGPYDLVLEARLAAFESTITSPIANYETYVAGPSDSTLALVGANTFAGSFDVAGYPFGTDNTVAISDVEAADGAIVQQGVLTNIGSISSDDHYTELEVTGSADAELVNDGSLGASGRLDVGTAVVGSGTIFDGAYDGNDVTLRKAVVASQTVDLTIGNLNLLDAIDFRATIVGFSTFLSNIELPQQIDAARFVDHTLVLTAGGQVVAELKFAADTQAGDFVIASSSHGTTITPVRVPGGESNVVLPPPNITVTATGTVPNLPPIVLPTPVAKLAATGPNLTFTTGAHVASVETLAGHTIQLDGATASRAPAVDETSTVFAKTFELTVAGQGDATAYGSLNAVGYDENDGTVAATSGSGGGSATLAMNLSDVTASDGTVILAAAFNNTGTIDAAVGGTIDLTGTADSKLINSGTVVADGKAFVGPSVTGTGTIIVGGQGSLELGGATATGQSIDLLAGMLAIDDAKHFFATIDDFTAADRIVLRGLDVTSRSYGNGALTLNGGADGTLHFHRPTGVSFDTASFALTQSGADTIISFVPHG